MTGPDTDLGPDTASVSDPSPRPDDPAPRAAARQTRFLQRQTYRRARTEDAARLMPVLGAFLFFGPVVIQTDGVRSNGGAGIWLIYFLGIWLGLVILAAVLARVLNSPPRPLAGDGPQAPRAEPAPMPMPDDDGARP